MRGLAELHAGVDDLADFERVSSTSVVPLGQDSGWVEPLTTDLSVELAPQLDSRTDRVVGQRIQRFESNVHVFRYATKMGKGVVRVSGQPPAVLPDADWRGLRRRAMVGVAVGVLLTIVGFVAVGHYIGQADWFRQHGNGGPMGLLALVAAVFGSLALVGGVLPASGRTVTRFKAPAALFLLAWVGIGGLWHTNGPSEASVATALEAGELDDARVELEALRVVAGQSDAIAELFGQLETAEASQIQQQHEEEDAAHLARIVASDDAESGLAAARGGWHDADVAAQAREAVIGLARADIKAAIATGSTAKLNRLALVAAPLDKTLGELAAQRAHLAEAEDAIEARSFGCAATALDNWKPTDGDSDGKQVHDDLEAKLSRELSIAIKAADLEEPDLDRRLNTLDSTLTEARLYERVSGEGSPRSIAKLEKARSTTSSRLDKQRKKAAATDERRRKSDERKARSAAKKTQAVKRRAGVRSNRVQCCDGSLSPSCRYGRSLRGCCSHHGGVC